MKKTIARAKAMDKRIRLDAERWADMVANGIFYDPRLILDERGNARHLKDLADPEAYAIAGLELVKRNLQAGDGATDEIIKYRFVDRAKFLELGGRYLAVFQDKLAVTHRLDLESLVSGSQDEEP